MIREFMMTWVALAFTTGTLSILSVADDTVTAGEETLASPSSTCSRGERQEALSRAGESHTQPWGKKLLKFLECDTKKLPEGRGLYHP